jgi:hypothetical protein
MVKPTAALLLTLLLACGTAPAQQAISRTQEAELYRAGHAETERTPLDLIRLESSYVFESELRNGGPFGRQDAWQGLLEYSHRFRISGRWHLRTGVQYHRFEFGDTAAPVPEKLHSLSALVGIEYVVGRDLGAFLHVWPGFYAEDDFNGKSFDVPFTLARAWVLRQEELYLITGVNVAFLRGQLPVLPLAGLIWRPNEQWAVLAMMPEPRVVYAPSKEVSFWLGGQLSGGSFRTSDDPSIVPQRLSGAAVDYIEYRAGAGVEFHMSQDVSFGLGGGWAFQRRFNFERADIDYKAQGAPYLRAFVKAEF